MDASSRRVALIGLVVLHLLAVSCCSILALAKFSESQTFGGILLGTVFAQASLLAVWLALGGQPFLRRTVWVLLLTTASIILFMLPVAKDAGDDWIISLFFGAAIFSQWLAVQTPLWLIRVVFGWRITAPDTLCAGAGRDELQFGIKQLLAWTTAIAVLLGIGRWLADDIAGDDHNSFLAWEIAAIFLLLAGCNVVVAWPVIWAALVRRWMPAWTVVAVVIAVILTLEEPAIFRRVAGGGMDAELVWWVNGVHLAWIYGSLGVLRMYGYRMERRSKGSVRKGD